MRRPLASPASIKLLRNSSQTIEGYIDIRQSEFTVVSRIVTLKEQYKVAIKDTPKVGIVSIPLVSIAGHAKGLEIACVVRAAFGPWDDMIDV